MTPELINKLLTHFNGISNIPYTDLFAFIQNESPGVADKTINWKINQLKSKGLISHISRGIYSLKKKNEYIPELSPNLKRIFNRVKTNLPYVNLCIWDSRWFNEFMIHQMFKYYIVVETEKDATDSVFNTLSDYSKKVFLDPDKEIYTRYIINHDEVIIVKPLITEAPLLELEKIKIPAIEKLLIDSLIDIDLFAAQQDELDNIYKSVFEKYLVNLNKIKRYARRRDQLSKFESKIEKLSLNK